MIARTLLVLALAVVPPLMAQPCSAAAVKHGTKFFVVAVGISHYDSQPPLASPEREVLTLAEHLSNRGCIPRDHVLVLTGHAADRSTILQVFSGATRRVKPGDTLIFIFSGHGAEIDGETLLMPRETFLDDDSIETLRTEAISVTTLKQIVREKHISDAVFFVDACRTFPPFRNTSRITVVSASQPGQPSYEVNDAGLLIQSLTKQLDQPRASVLTMFDKARIEVEQKATASGVRQFPTIVVDAPPGKEQNTDIVRRQPGEGSSKSLAVLFGPAHAASSGGGLNDHSMLVLAPLTSPPILERLN